MNALAQLINRLKMWASRVVGKVNRNSLVLVHRGTMRA